MRILWIPHVAWHIPQRAHIFCRALAERHEVHVTDWVADFVRPRDFLTRQYLGNFFYRRYREENITIHGIPRVAPALMSPVLRRMNIHLFERTVARIVDAYRIDVVVGTFVVPPPKAPRLIFDLFDENVTYWINYRNFPSYAREIEQREDAYFREADAVVTVSSVLQDKAMNRRSSAKPGNVFLIPNGIDLESFRRADTMRVRQLYGLSGKKVIGFISALGEFVGLHRLLEAFSQISGDQIALMVVGDGPELKPAKKWAEERGLTNIIFSGKVPFEQIPDYYASLDVGVIPFDKSPFTDAACPIKLLEYTAARKIVVSTDLEEIHRMDFRNVVLTNSNVDSLVDGLRRALIMSAPREETGKIDRYDIRLLVKQYESILQPK
jgi:glycosyltransferase involved in cell wall biosynthesis